MVVRANKILNFSNEYIYKEEGIRFVMLRNRGKISGNKGKGIKLLYSLKWDNIICDEVQNISNWKTISFQSIYSLSCENFFGLSGTPIRNNQTELFCLLKVLNIRDYPYPGRWKKEYICKSYYDLFYTLDYKDTHIKEIKTESKIEYVDMEETQKKVYEMYVDHLYDLYKDSVSKDNFGENMTMIIGLFTRLRQLSFTPYLLSYELGKARDQLLDIVNEKIKIDKIKFKNNKMLRLFKILNEINKRGEKVIIFSSFTMYLKLLNKRLKYKSTMILSEDSISKRNKKIDEWKESKENNIIMMNYRIGSEGLNLIESNNVILLDSWWNFSLEEQAIARAKRQGQEKKVNIYRIMTKNSIEMLIFKKAQYKVDLFDKLKNDKEIKKLTINKELLKEIIYDLKRYNELD